MCNKETRHAEDAFDKILKEEPKPFGYPKDVRLDYKCKSRNDLEKEAVKGIRKAGQTGEPYVGLVGRDLPIPDEDQIIQAVAGFYDRDPEAVERSGHKLVVVYGRQSKTSGKLTLAAWITRGIRMALASGAIPIAVVAEREYGWKQVRGRDGLWEAVSITCMPGVHALVAAEATRIFRCAICGPRLGHFVSLHGRFLGLPSRWTEAFDFLAYVEPDQVAAISAHFAAAKLETTNLGLRVQEEALGVSTRGLSRKPSNRLCHQTVPTDDVDTENWEGTPPKWKFQRKPDGRETVRRVLNALRSDASYTTLNAQRKECGYRGMDLFLRHLLDPLLSGQPHFLPAKPEDAEPLETEPFTGIAVLTVEERDELVTLAKEAWATKPDPKRRKRQGRRVDDLGKGMTLAAQWHAGHQDIHIRCRGGDSITGARCEYDLDPMSEEPQKSDRIMYTCANPDEPHRQAWPPRDVEQEMHQRVAAGSCLICKRVGGVKMMSIKRLGKGVRVPARCEECGTKFEYIQTTKRARTEQKTSTGRSRSVEPQGETHPDQKRISSRWSRRGRRDPGRIG